MKKNIVWLASYPKSGNTWFRAFLTALIGRKDQVGINQLIGSQVYSPMLFEDSTGLNPSELHFHETEELKPLIAQYLSEQSEENIYLKTHEEFRLLPNGHSILPASHTKAVLYFVRNPLDVAPSYANHNGSTVDHAIKSMGKYTWMARGKNKEFTPVPHLYGTWSSHVISWVNCQHHPVTLIRYEDMLRNPLDTFSKAVKAIGLDHSQEEIASALAASSFQNLQAQESSEVFAENPTVTSSFFRKGKAGTWREELTDQQVDDIICAHQKAMQLTGYLTAHGKIADNL